MSKQETLDKYWMEFIEFYAKLMREAKEEELDSMEDGMDIGKMLGMLGDKKTFQRTLAYQEFNLPSETNFWKWYALVKLNSPIRETGEK